MQAELQRWADNCPVFVAPGMLSSPACLADIAQAQASALITVLRPYRKRCRLRAAVRAGKASSAVVARRVCRVPAAAGHCPAGS